MSTQPHVVDLDGAHAVVVPDWHSYNSMLGIYCGDKKFDDSLRRMSARNRSGTDLYILCNDAERAGEMFALLPQKSFELAQQIAIGRCPTYANTVKDLVANGHAVVCDTLGADCDDRRIKAMYPPPDGSTIDFQWDAVRKFYRMRCTFTGKDGATKSQSIILRNGEDWPHKIATGYRRFAGKSPPRPSGLVCLPHVAAALKRLDWHGARRLSDWRLRMEAAGIDAHQEVSPLVIAGASIEAPGELLSIELKGTRGSLLVSTTCRYHGGTTIKNRILDLKADLPLSVITGMTGLAASAIWGEPDLSDMTVSHPAKTKNIGFVLAGDVAPLPAPTPNPPDEDREAADLLAFPMPDTTRIEGVVLHLMSQMPPSARLHVYRTLMSMDEVELDISPWLPGSPQPMLLKHSYVTISHYQSGYYSTTEGISL